jgi:hypothetical protein
MLAELDRGELNLSMENAFESWSKARRKVKLLGGKPWAESSAQSTSGLQFNPKSIELTSENFSVCYSNKRRAN